MGDLPEGYRLMNMSDGTYTVYRLRCSCFGGCEECVLEADDHADAIRIAREDASRRLRLQGRSP